MRPRAQPAEADAAGLALRIRLTPRGGRDAFDGVAQIAGDIVLKARVRAAPENGEANAALEKLVAKALGVPKSSVAVVGGTTARMKKVRVVGDPTELAARCQRLVAALSRPQAAD